MRGCDPRQLVLVPLLSVALAGCSGPSPGEKKNEKLPAGAATLSVYAVNYPLAYFAERIGGERVTVEFPAPPEVDPAFWSPDAETIGAFQRADLVLLNGAGYAGWIAHASLPPSRLVDTSAGFRDRYVPIENAVTHAHGPEGEHAHGDVAFTTWLDLRLAVEQARAIAAALQRAMPQGEGEFRQELERLEGELLSLDATLREAVARGAPPLLGSHPVYQYLAEGYGLEIRSVHFEPGEFPAETAWSDLDRLLAEQPAGWMLWEGQPSERTTQALLGRGVKSVVFDPCGNVPSTGSFLDLQRANVESLSEIVRR